MTKDDVEFYEAPLVLKAAQSLLPPGVAWDDLSHRAKQDRLDKAVAMLHALLNDAASMQRLAWLAAHTAKSKVTA